MLTDLVLSPFDAAMGDVLEAASVADEAGFSAVWTYDHFSATMGDKQWSHHPFTMLGAIAARTERVAVGCLVANLNNRHITQVASAVGTLASIAPGRVFCGLGAGAGPGSYFATEQTMIGRTLERAAVRRRRLADDIDAYNALWAHKDYSGEFVELRSPAGDGNHAIVPDVPVPPVIVGASTLDTALVAAEHADGVNLRVTPELEETVERTRETFAARRPGDLFDIGVNLNLDLDHPLGGDPSPYEALGVTRRTMAVFPPYSLDAIRRIGQNLAEAS